MENLTLQVENQRVMEFELFLQEFNLERNVVSSSCSDFWTNFSFEGLEDMEVNWLLDF